MSLIKLVAWDFYGTLMKTRDDEERDDQEEPYVLREKARESLMYVQSQSLIQVTISDSDLTELKRDMQKSGISPSFFIDSYQMQPYEQKNLQLIWQDFRLHPENLLVIGDNYEIDIALAKRQGCSTLHVPESEGSLPLDKIKVLL